MPNAEHLAMLKRGVLAWNQWREKSPAVKPDLSGADLSGADLSGINLNGANLSITNFRSARLLKADLSITTLISTSLPGADLSGANLYGANLYGAYLERAYLEGTHLKDAYLESANLVNANLYEANLEGADLNQANFQKSQLYGANLIAVQALQTNFSEATLTGACIRDWHINRKTNFSQVKCLHLYQSCNEETGEFTRRLPVDPHETFAPGEFFQVFQAIDRNLDTVHLTFDGGIDWQALAQAFQLVGKQYPQATLEIHGMERRGMALIVTLAVSRTADKMHLANEIEQHYQTQLALTAVRYREALQVGEQDIERYRQKSADLLEVMKRLAKYSPTLDGQETVPIQGVECSNRG